jgi:hypothetical protein
MRTTNTWRPSPAMLVAMIALTLGLAGSAVAADALSKSDVKKIAKKQAKKEAKKGFNARVAYARVADDGDVIEADSRRVSDSNVTLEETSAFCFRNLPFDFKTAQVTIDYADASGDEEIAQVALGDAGGDCEGSAELEVATANAFESDFEPFGFFILFVR